MPILYNISFNPFRFNLLFNHGISKDVLIATVRVLNGCNYIKAPKTRLDAFYCFKKISNIP